MSKERIEFTIQSGQAKSDAKAIQYYPSAIILPKSLAGKTISFFLVDRPMNNDNEGVALEEFPIGFLKSGGSYEKIQIAVPEVSEFVNTNGDSVDFIVSSLIYSDLKSCSQNKIVLKIDSSITEESKIYVVVRPGL